MFFFFCVWFLASLYTGKVVCLLGAWHGMAGIGAGRMGVLAPDWNMMGRDGVLDFWGFSICMM